MRCSLRWLAAFFAAPFALTPAVGCDASLQVGDLRDPPQSDAGITLPEQDASIELTTRAWQLRSPSIPCTIHSMAEVRADRLYVGCDGGRMYRFDGVTAVPDYEIDDKQTFSLLWAALDGKVWAATQSRSVNSQASQLHHFDGKAWSKVDGFGTARLMALAGVASDDVWAATAQRLSHFDGAKWSASHQISAGEFRSCAFVAKDKGYCAGTEGVALAWNGAAWAPMVSPPWSTSAEVLGIEARPFNGGVMFVYAEPHDTSAATHDCRIAKWDGGWTSYQAVHPCSPGHDVSRKRVSYATVGGPSAYTLLSFDEQYGGTIYFDAAVDEWKTICGPALTFAAGTANTRVGGFDGFLGTLVGSGSQQVRIESFGGSDQDFKMLSVARNGAAWARTELSTACGSISDRLVRFEGTSWKPVAAPQDALSGFALAALSLDQALSLSHEGLRSFEGGNWSDPVATLDLPRAMWASSASDVWIGGNKDDFGHYDGQRFEVIAPPGRGRQMEEVVGTPSGDVWLVAQGYTQNDLDMHIYHYDEGKLTTHQRNSGPMAVKLSALDRTHAWTSGSPAQAWDGTSWRALPFDASAVWARTPDEIWFAKWGDIYRYDGTKLELVYRGLVRISAIGGSADRGFAVGPGGLTIELTEAPVVRK